MSRIDIETMRKRYADLSVMGAQHAMRQDAFRSISDDGDSSYISDVEADRWFVEDMKYANDRFSNLAVDIQSVDAAYDNGDIGEELYSKLNEALGDLTERNWRDVTIMQDAAKVWDNKYGTDYSKQIDDMFVPATPVQTQSQTEVDIQPTRVAEPIREVELAQAQRAAEEEREREAVENLPLYSRRKAHGFGLGE